MVVLLEKEAKEQDPLLHARCQTVLATRGGCGTLVWPKGSTMPLSSYVSVRSLWAEALA